MKKIKTLAALISTSLSANNDTQAIPKIIKTYDSKTNMINISPLNKNVSYYLADHRSHSSHRSHRSSSGGGYSSRSYSTPSYSYTPPKVSTTPKTSSTTVTPSYIYSTHDPLGQDSKPKNTFNENKSSTDSNTTKVTEQKELTKDEKKEQKEKLKKVITQVQLTLFLEGLYTDSIDGIMGKNTRSAVQTFKKDHNITSEALLGTETLNALGVKGF